MFQYFILIVRYVISKGTIIKASILYNHLYHAVQYANYIECAISYCTMTHYDLWCRSHYIPHFIMHCVLPCVHFCLYPSDCPWCGTAAASCSRFYITSKQVQLVQASVHMYTMSRFDTWCQILILLWEERFFTKQINEQPWTRSVCLRIPCLFTCSFSRCLSL